MDHFKVLSVAAESTVFNRKLSQEKTTKPSIPNEGICESMLVKSRHDHHVMLRHVT